MSRWSSITTVFLMHLIILIKLHYYSWITYCNVSLLSQSVLSGLFFNSSPTVVLGYLHFLSFFFFKSVQDRKCSLRITFRLSALCAYNKYFLSSGAMGVELQAADQSDGACAVIPAAAAASSVCICESVCSSLKGGNLDTLSE